MPYVFVVYSLLIEASKSKVKKYNTRILRLKGLIPPTPLLKDESSKFTAKGFNDKLMGEYFDAKK